MHQAATRNQVRNADTLAVALGGDRQAYVWGFDLHAQCGGAGRSRCRRTYRRAPHSRSLSPRSPPTRLDAAESCERVPCQVEECASSQRESFRPPALLSGSGRQHARNRASDASANSRARGRALGEPYLLCPSPRKSRRLCRGGRLPALWTSSAVLGREGAIGFATALLPHQDEPARTRSNSAHSESSSVGRVGCSWLLSVGS